MSDSASVYFCFTSDGEVHCNCLGWSWPRYNFAEMHSSSGLNSILCIHQCIISGSFICTGAGAKWRPSGQLFRTVHDARDLDSGVKVMDASCKNLF